MTTEPVRRCTVCNRTMKPSYKSPATAEAVHQGRGMCARDYAAWQRTQAKNARLSDTVEVAALAGFMSARRRRGVPATGLAVAS